MWKVVAALGVAMLLAVGALSLPGPGARAQSGACGTSHDGLSAEEQEFLGMIQSWRNSNVQPSSQLEISGALNAAAAWYAQWQVENGAPGGHGDTLGRTWVQRAIDCGYSGSTSGGTPYAFGSGEGTFAIAGSLAANVTLSQALTGITYQGSGVRIQTSSMSLPAKCVGVGIYQNAAGTARAFIVVIAQYPANAPCPGSTGSSPPTQTPTPSSTPLASPTPSPTATPRADGASVTLWQGWNLVTLPAGDVAEVLTRARGCYRTVYQQVGDVWLRYSPDVPAYANNLKTTTGGTFWMEGTANCGFIQL